MGITDDIADKLAIEALQLEVATGDDQFVVKVSEILGASSQTTQEAFLTSVRVRRAEARAQKFIETARAKLDAERVASGDDLRADAGD